MMSFSHSLLAPDFFNVQVGDATLRRIEVLANDLKDDGVTTAANVVTITQPGCGLVAISAGAGSVEYTNDAQPLNRDGTWRGGRPSAL